MDDNDNEALFHIDVQISFGHCDAAGIVFYPNFYRWFDRCFQTYLLHHHGGHAEVCRKLGSRGTGLMSAEAKFVSPAVDGDVMRLTLMRPEWHNRAFTLRYLGQIGDRVNVHGIETRAVFIEEDGRLTAGSTAKLRAMVEAA
jgi:acyl-CoA thioesterase FadM